MYICKERKTSFPTKMVFYQRVNDCKEFSGSLAPKQWLSLQTSSTALTHARPSAGGHALTPLITGFAPARRAYHINRSVPPLPHTLPPHLQRLYVYARFKLHYLTAGSDTGNLKGSSLPQQVSELEDCSEPALPQPQASLTCYTRGTSQGKVTAQLSPRWWTGRPWAAWAPLHTGQPSPQASPEDTKMLWGPKLTSSHQTFKEKKLSSVYIRFS